MTPEIKFRAGHPPGWELALAKAEACCKRIGEKRRSGKIHGCGRVHCCLEFEMEKGEASDFEIRKKTLK